MKSINCFLAYQDAEQAQATVTNLRISDLVKNIYLLATEPGSSKISGCEIIEVDSIQSSETVRKIAEKSDAE